MKVDFEGVTINFADFDTVNALCGIVSCLKGDYSICGDFPFFDDVQKSKKKEGKK